MANVVRDAIIDSLKFRNIGPHRGGRVVAVGGDVRNRETFYMGAVAGGVWKTTDAGQTWRNISDGFFNTSAVGALAVSVSDPNVIYVGTGESSIRGNVSHGDGVYKSTNAGRTWVHLGLETTRHIGKIQIHPTNPDHVYVAAFGHAWGPSEDRGVYRSTDGGATWELVLHKSATAGSHDVSMDPNNPRILYASIWQAQRYPHKLESGGEECGLWRSFDGGDTWEEISRKPGLPTGMFGKTGIVASPAKPGRVYTVIEAEDGAVFRSDDYGDHWVRGSEEPLLRTRPWYYMHVTADPVDADTVYVQDYGIWKSIDAGRTFRQLPTRHGDEHAIWIDPNDNTRMIKGDDGGAAVSFNAGGTWSTIFNQPTAQLYHVTTNDEFPYRVFGSQQDNTTISVPSRSKHGAIHERDWYIPGGGESGYVAIKPDEPWHVVASGPVGRHAYNDLMTHYDHRTGATRDVSVWPELFGWGVGAESLKYRLQWTFPIMFSPHAPHPLYVAGNVLFRSGNLGSSFEVISPDLTRNDPDKLKPSGGPITRDNTGAEVYCTIFALAESPHTPGVLWAGSDDGLIHRTDDGGKNWMRVTPPDLPEWALISIIELSPHEEGVAFVAATRYKHDDTKPYLYRTRDSGATWTLITNGIPDHEFTRVIREDPNRRGLLYAGTETGIYISTDDGENWQRIGGNFPVTPVPDLVIKNSDLVVATHGRSFWILDDLTPLYQSLERNESSGVTLFTPRDTYRLRNASTTGWVNEPGLTGYGMVGPSQIMYDVHPDGSTQLLTAGDNPDEGVVIQYFLGKEANDVVISFSDSEGNVVREYANGTAPGNAGMNRFVWNLRYPGVASPKASDLAPWERHEGTRVIPGRYTVTLKVDGTEHSADWNLLQDPDISTPHVDLVEQRDYLLKVLEALGTTNKTVDRVDGLRAQLDIWRDRAESDEMIALVNEIRNELDDIRRKLIDVHRSGAQLYPTGLHEKFNALLDSNDRADSAPPRQSVEVYEKLNGELYGLIAWLADIESEGLAGLNRSIVQSGQSPIGMPGER
jgi:photosystem II stability/assembly factor-like uncharacterized protein